jgi:membrane protein
MFFLKNFLSVIYTSCSNLSKHDGFEMSGYLAFLMALSIFPCTIFLTKLITVFCYFIDKNVLIDSFVKSLDGFENLPVKKIKEEILDIVIGPPRLFVNFAIFGILWTSSSTTQGLKYILNKAYNGEFSPYILTRLYSIIQFIFVSFIALLTIFTLQFLPKVIIYINENFSNEYLHSFDSTILYFFQKYSYIVNLLLLFVYVIWINIILPNKKLFAREVWIGSALTVICWVICSEVLMIYFDKFLQFNLIYGSLANIVSILLYFYVIFLCFIFGAEFNSSLMNFKLHKTPEN